MNRNNESKSGCTVIYDDGCEVCCRFRRKIEQGHFRGKIEFLPLSKFDFETHPTLGATSARPDSIILLDDQKNVFYAEEAIGWLLKRGTALQKILGWLLSLPVLKQVAGFIYGSVARHRHRLSSVIAWKHPVRK